MPSLTLLRLALGMSVWLSKTSISTHLTTVLTKTISVSQLLQPSWAWRVPALARGKDLDRPKAKELYTESVSYTSACLLRIKVGVGIMRYLAKFSGATA